MILVSMESFEKGFLENRSFENTSWYPDHKIGVQIWENWGKSACLREDQTLKFFEILVFQHLCITINSVASKFERKPIKTLNLIAHSICKSFDKQIPNLDQRATVKRS